MIGKRIKGLLFNANTGRRRQQGEDVKSQVTTINFRLRFFPGEPSRRPRGSPALITIGALILLTASGLTGELPTAGRLQGMVSAVGPDGQPFSIPGVSASQSGLVVNSANVTDPATGEYAINLPIEAIQSVQVLTNPYAPEYGKFTAGVTSIETRRGTDQWKTQFQDFFPRVRRREGHFVGLASVTPRLTFSGPLLGNTVKFFQSFEYRFARTEIEARNLPPLDRDKVLESFDSFTQFDWEIDAANHLATSFSVFPQKLGFVNLNTFNPQVAAGLASRPWDPGRLAAAGPVYVLAQKGLRYFENQAGLDYLEQHEPPVKEIWVDGVRTTRIYKIEPPP